MAPKYQEVTMEERMRMMGQTVTDEDRAFHEAWRTYNRSVGIRAGVSVADHREIGIMRAFFNAGKQFATPSKESEAPHE